MANICGNQWDAIGRLITAYFSRSRSGDQGRQIAEHEYAELTCDSHESVSIFLCIEAECYDDVTRTGASYTGYTRIQLVQPQIIVLSVGAKGERVHYLNRQLLPLVRMSVDVSIARQVHKYLLPCPNWESKSFRPP